MVTDHIPREKKYNTTSKEEDEHFFNYKKWELKEYNADAVRVKSTQKPKKRLEDYFDDNYGYTKAPDGANYYKLENHELYCLEELKYRYEELKKKSGEVCEPIEPLEIDPEESNSIFKGYDPKDPYFKDLYT